MTAPVPFEPECLTCGRLMDDFGVCWHCGLPDMDVTDVTRGVQLGLLTTHIRLITQGGVGVGLSAADARTLAAALLLTAERLEHLGTIPLPFPFASILSTRAALTQELTKLGRGHELDDMELASRAGRRDKLVAYVEPSKAALLTELLTSAGFRVELNEAEFDDELSRDVMSGRVFW